MLRGRRIALLSLVAMLGIVGVIAIPTAPAAPRTQAAKPAKPAKLTVGLAVLRFSTNGKTLHAKGVVIATLIDQAGNKQTIRAPVAMTALAGGCLLAFDNPVRRSFVTEMVEEDDVANAVTLYSALVNTSRIFGPALAGLLVVTVGFGWCFALDAVSYIAVLVALWLMHTDELRRVPVTPRGKGQVRAGLRYVRSVPELWLPVVLAVLCVMGVLAGILLRVKAFLFLGVSFLLLDVFTMIWHAAVNRSQTWLWWASGIVLGVAILTLFAVFEKRRNDVLKLVEEIKSWD